MAISKLKHRNVRIKRPLVRPTVRVGRKPVQQVDESWAISTKLAEHLYEHLLETQPKCIVECGSGLSTRYLSQYAEKHGAFVLSLEHDEGWFKQTQIRYKPKAVKLVHAPLGEDNWFDVDLPAQLEGRQVEFVLVDGPPGSTGGRERTLAHLLPHLANGAEVWLHDAMRKAEQQIFKTWQATVDGFELLEVETQCDARGTMKARIWKSGRE